MNGPTLSLVARCSGCHHMVSESYSCQGDSGHDIYCNHPRVQVEDGKRRHVGGSCRNAPDWCPVLPVAQARAVAIGAAWALRRESDLTDSERS